MKKATKKSAAKTSKNRKAKDLAVTPARGGTVRGGDKAIGRTNLSELQISKNVDKSSPVLFTKV